jgi:hypothetical protein
MSCSTDPRPPSPKAIRSTGDSEKVPDETRSNCGPREARVRWSGNEKIDLFGSIRRSEKAFVVNCPASKNPPAPTSDPGQESAAG